MSSRKADAHCFSIGVEARKRLTTTALDNRTPGTRTRSPLRPSGHPPSSESANLFLLTHLFFLFLWCWLRNLFGWKMLQLFLLLFHLCTFYLPLVAHPRINNPKICCCQCEWNPYRQEGLPTSLTETCVKLAHPSHVPWNPLRQWFSNF